MILVLMNDIMISTAIIKDYRFIFIKMTISRPWNNCAVFMLIRMLVMMMGMLLCTLEVLTHFNFIIHVWSMLIPRNPSIR